MVTIITSALQRQTVALQGSCASDFSDIHLISSHQACHEMARPDNSSNQHYKARALSGT